MALLETSPLPPDGRARKDPLDRVMQLGSRRAAVLGASALVALLAHGTAAARISNSSLDLLAWSRGVRSLINERLAATYDVEVEKPKEPEPPPPEEKPEPEVKPEPALKVAKRDVVPAAPPPPPAAAQAAQVVTREPDPNEPVDFTNTFVSGNGATFAGGVTQAGGTSKTAVRDRAASASGVPGGVGTAPVPSGPDRSRGARLLGSHDWNVPFPPEADAEQIDTAEVTLELAVNADGSVASAKIVKDAGHGFGRDARRYALRQRFEPALDHDGNPRPQIMRIPVHFER